MTSSLILEKKNNIREKKAVGPLEGTEQQGGKKVEKICGKRDDKGD